MSDLRVLVLVALWACRPALVAQSASTPGALELVASQGTHVSAVELSIASAPGASLLQFERDGAVVGQLIASPGLAPLTVFDSGALPEALSPPALSATDGSAEVGIELVWTDAQRVATPHTYRAYAYDNTGMIIATSNDAVGYRGSAGQPLTYSVSYGNQDIPVGAALSYVDLDAPQPDILVTDPAIAFEVIASEYAAGRVAIVWNHAPLQSFAVSAPARNYSLKTYLDGKRVLGVEAYASGRRNTRSNVVWSTDAEPDLGAVSATHWHALALSAQATTLTATIHAAGSQVALHSVALQPAPALSSYAGGGQHTCGLVATGADQGKALCWGQQANDRLRPPGAARSGDIGAAFPFTQISAGEAFTCGVIANALDTGRAVCWGAADFDATKPPGAATAGAVGASYVYSAISAGFSHVCGLLVGGASANHAICWGSSAPWPTGATGPNTAGTGVYTQIASGQGFSCGLRADGGTPGQADCWGIGAPVPPSTPLSTLSAAAQHACGLIAAGADAGKAICWGQDYQGTIVPPGAASAGAVGQTYVFSAVSSRGAHNCAIIGAGTHKGRAVCWGYAADDRTKPPGAAAPGDVGRTYTFSALTAGSSHTCASVDVGPLPSDHGRTVCWGYNQNQEATPPGTAPVLPSGSQSPYSQVSAGKTHACAIRKGDGHALCWGSSDAVGQLQPPGAPGPLEPGDTFAFKQIAAGADFACGLIAVPSADAGHVACWGVIGTQTQPPGAQASGDIGGAFQFVELAAGWNHVCAIIAAGPSAGRALCWGDNSEGQAAPVGTSGPLSIGTQYTFSALAAGAGHTCGIIGTGPSPDDVDRVLCWGDAVSATGSSKPPGWTLADPVGRSFRFRMLAAGAHHSCGIVKAGPQASDTGKVVCWGDASAGKTQPPGAAANGYPGTAAVSEVFSGGDCSCALDAVTGMQACWGNCAIDALAGFAQLAITSEDVVGLRDDGAIFVFGRFGQAWSGVY